MAEKTVPAPTASEGRVSKEGTRAEERYVVPPVDIYETTDGLVLMADLPGVSKDALDVRVEDNLLTIQGRTSHAVPGSPLHREFELVNYFRQFELSEKVNQAGIGASLKHGVLKLDLPKAEKAKPRQIEVSVG
jgi:HSP20 family protein